MTNETKVLIGIGVATLVIVVAATFLIGGKSNSNAQVNTEPVANAEALVRSNSHKIEVKGAKITFVEFGDIQCPACGAAFPVVQQLLGDYKGKLTFAFRQFPLQMHQNAQPAANAAEAAGVQGKFFEMVDKMYENQAEWSESKTPMDIFTKYAQQLKLDVKKFKDDATKKKYQKNIDADIKDGFAVGVNATPTFYINGVKQEGGIDYQTYKAQFDKILNSK